MGDVAQDEGDFTEAATWYKRAAIQGSGDAQQSLGEMYVRGEGVSQDFVEAYKWFNIAANSTNAPPTNGVVFKHELTPAQREYLAPFFKPQQKRHEVRGQNWPNK